MNVIIATYQHTIAASAHLLHPSTSYACASWLTEARKCAASGLKREAAHWLLLIDTRLEQEAAWQAERFGVDLTAPGTSH